MKIVLYSIIAVAFLACGGTTSSGGLVKKDNSLLSSNISGNILVVEDMKKDVKVTASRDNVTYRIVNKKDISGVEIDKNRGLVTFWSNGAVGSIVTVIVEASDESGWKSKPLSLVFQTVSKNIAPTKKIIKTGAIDGGAGADRNFVVEGEYVRDPFGNVWENKLDEKKAKASLYQLAENRCAVLKAMNKDSNWRIPTSNELLNILDYNKSATLSMIDSAFEESNLNLWVESEDNKYQVFSQTSGLISNAKLTDRHAVRCINAPKKEDSYHVISSGSTIGADTYDFSTGLIWSAMDRNAKRKIVDEVEENAFEYCYSYDNASGWRLPNINEIRSVVEGNTISNNILNSNTIIVSSTPYVSSDVNAKAANYIVGIENNKVVYGVSYADMAYPITCVKEIR